MKKLVLVLPFLLVLNAHAQVQRSGDLVAYLDSLISIMPSELDGDFTTLPAPSGADRWTQSVAAILEGNYEQADTLCAAIDYRVVLWTDAGEQHVILERNIEREGPYWGTFVHPVTPQRPHLMVQAPHPVKDTNTGRQAVRVYDHALPGGLMLPGTSRCDSPTFSSCDGTTSICSGSSEAYRISDQAHIATGTFQLTTQAFLEHDPEVVVLQPHGFGRGETDPHLILSNGTKLAPTGEDWALELRDAIIAERDTMTFKVGHLDAEWDRLLGTTNTQGRLLNGSGNPCDDNANNASGQFIHLEQSYDDLRYDENGWMVLATAVAAAFPPMVESVEEQGALPLRFDFVSVRPNPFNAMTEIEFRLEHSSQVNFEVWNMQGQLVTTLANGRYSAGGHHVSWQPSVIASGIYLLRLSTPEGVRNRRVTYLK